MCVTQYRRGLWLRRRWDSCKIGMIASSLYFRRSWIYRILEFSNFISFQRIFFSDIFEILAILFLNKRVYIFIFLFARNTRREFQKSTKLLCNHILNTVYINWKRLPPSSKQSVYLKDSYPTSKAFFSKYTKSHRHSSPRRRIHISRACSKQCFHAHRFVQSKHPRCTKKKKKALSHPLKKERKKSTVSID